MMTNLASASPVDQTREGSAMDGLFPPGASDAHRPTEGRKSGSRNGVTTRPEGHCLLVGLLALFSLSLGLVAGCTSRRLPPPPPPGPAAERDGGTEAPRDSGTPGTAGPRRPAGACNGPAEMKRPLGTTCGCHEECGSGQCVDGVCCNNSCTGTCQACNVPGRAGTCSPVPDGTAPVVAGQCAAEAAASCGLDGLCDGSGGCRRYPEGTVCDEGRCQGNQVVDIKACSGGSCKATSTVSCSPYACDASNRRCHGRCTNDAECAGAKCEAGSCGQKPLGAACVKADECESNICTDGVCCNIACTGPCVSCREAGNVGVCSPAAAGRTDPHGLCKVEPLETCGLTGLCNGQGGCARVAVGTICRPGSCSGATFNPPSACDEDGSCAAGTPTTCAPFLCDDAVCRGTCTNNDQCLTPAVCTNGSCGPKAIGQTCKANNECASYFCVDGVCCNSACTGLCSSCALPNAPGRCTVVPAGVPDPRAGAGITDPARACIDQGVGSCGNNGRCDGKGACQRYEEGSICRDETCDAGANRSSIGTCAGGSCRITTRGCAPNLCNGDRCGIRCDNDNQCAEPNVCQNASCGKRPNGSPCSANNPAECASGICAQGVCCAGPCTGSCVSCALPQSLGICAAVPDGMPDPEKVCVDQKPASCGTDGKCNGRGGCRRYAAGTLCSAATCKTGTATKASFCDAAGQCPAPEIETCTPIIVCNAAGNACERTCTRDDQCMIGTKCFAGKCGLLDDGKTCDENNDCKSGACSDGVCCNSACGGNDKNDCQACSAKEGASKDGVCTLRSGRTCNDGNACTKVDLCVDSTLAPGSICQGTMPVICQAKDQCHSVGVCNTGTGVCTNPALPDATSCNDGNQCTVGDVCTAGVCRAGPAKSCPTPDQCHNLCDAMTGACNPPKPDNTRCDDGNKCTTGQDVCKAGICTGLAKTCTALDQCHTPGTCEPTTGVCSNPVKTDGSACEDGNKCTTGDQCTAGKCVKGTGTVACGATTCRLCDPATGTCTGTAKPNATACDDSNLCTTGEVCNAGRCAGGTTMACAIPACNRCVPTTGVCGPINEGGTCNDGRTCTTADKCTAGTCAGTPGPGCVPAPL
jgi:hypothetical protein